MTISLDFIAHRAIYRPTPIGGCCLWVVLPYIDTLYFVSYCSLSKVSEFILSSFLKGLSCYPIIKELMLLLTRLSSTDQ